MKKKIKRIKSKDLKKIKGKGNDFIIIEDNIMLSKSNEIVIEDEVTT